MMPEKLLCALLEKFTLPTIVAEGLTSNTPPPVTFTPPLVER